MDCYDCKAKSVCAAVVQPGSMICLMNRHEILRDITQRKNHGDSRATFASIVGIAAGDRTRALLQQCELPKPICERMRVCHGY